jgi:hypothetical protein
VSHRLSLLQRASKADVRSEPFPYIVIKNALPDDLYQELVTTRPSPALLGVDESKNNWRWNHRAELVAKDERVPALWKEFIAYQASAGFFNEIVNLFFDQIHGFYPKQFPSLDYAEKLRVGVRGMDSFRHKDVLMDAMISGNTPVQSATSVRTSHIDNGRKLFSGLFYMRRPEDDSSGGDLTISRYKNRTTSVAAKSALFKGAYVDDSNLEVVETVKYEPNSLVLFLNSIDSLHGVTVRQPTQHGRFFVNLVVETVTRLYRSRDGHPVYVEYAKSMDAAFPPMHVLLQRVKGNRGQISTD